MISVNSSYFLDQYINNGISQIIAVEIVPIHNQLKPNKNKTTVSVTVTCHFCPDMKLHKQSRSISSLISISIHHGFC